MSKTIEHTEPKTIGDITALLMDLADDVIIAELRRRAEARGMTTDELIQAAQDNWERAAAGADELKRLGHE